MISIVMEGMCKDCPCADLEVHRFMTDNRVARWVIQCNHNNACVRMKHETQDK